MIRTRKAGALKVAGGVAIVVLLLASTLYMYREHESGLRVSGATQTSEARKALAPRRVPQPEERVVVSVPPSGPRAFVAPSIDKPLVEIYAQLKEAADGGSAVAACRLGFELSRCGSLPQRRRSPDFWTQLSSRYEANAPQQTALKASLAKAEKALSEAEFACKGFTGDTTLAWDYYLIAARAGNKQALWRVVNAPPGLDRQHPENTLEGWYQWQQEAPGLIAQGISSGDPRVFRAAADYYLNPVFGNIRLFPEDPARSYALMSVILPVTAPRYRSKFENDLTYFRRKLSQSQIDKANVIAASLPPIRLDGGESVDWSQGMAPNESGKDCEAP